MTQPRFIEWVDAGWAGLAAKVAKRIGELQPLYADLGEMLRVRTQDRFKTGQAPDGTPWAPLADGSGRTPLTDSGTMACRPAHRAGQPPSCDRAFRTPARVIITVITTCRSPP